MSIEQVAARIKEKMLGAPELKTRVKFDFGAQGLIFVDSAQTPILIDREDQEADITFICELSTFESILAGTQDATLAFMSGKLKVKGPMGLAMKLNSILED